MQEKVKEISYLEEDFKSWVINEKAHNTEINTDTLQHQAFTNNSSNNETTQFSSFQRAMKFLFTLGVCLGLNPVTALLDNDINKIRFTVYSWKCLHSLLRMTSLTIVAGVALYALLNSTVIHVQSLGLLIFCISIWLTTFIFIYIAWKWEFLVKEIFNCNLDNYVDPDITFRCNATCITFLILAIIEHTLSMLSSVAEAFDCGFEKLRIYEQLIIIPLLSLEKENASYMLPAAIALQFRLLLPSWLHGLPKGFLSSFLSLAVMLSACSLCLFLRHPLDMEEEINHAIMALTWSYLDTFIICMSLYLTSVLNQINKKILFAADKTYLLPSIWGTLREEYSRATRLVRQFDEMFSGLILVSFAINLLWICLQLFSLLDDGGRPKMIHSGECSNYPSGPLYGYEYSLDNIYSLIFLISKFLAVSLVAANVNVVSLVPASALYKVPSCSYSVEVQRFLDQVHDDVVALSGMEYFYITRGLVLSVFGTILTYELVLLQFNSEELNSA